MTSHRPRVEYYNSNAELVSQDSSGTTNTSYTLKLDWTPEVPVGELLVHVDYVYEENGVDTGSPDFLDEFHAIPNYLDDTENLNARVAWTSDDGHYELALWGRNLLDQELIDGVRTISRSAFGTTFVGIKDPLTWGVEGRYNW